MMVRCKKVYDAAAYNMLYEAALARIDGEENEHHNFEDEADWSEDLISEGFQVYDK